MLTRTRVRTAYAVAVLVDAAQWLLGPLGWAFADELLDVGAMIVLWRVIGFHPLLLPTFVLELLPVADLLPTWTGCVALVLALRRKEEPSPPAPGRVIDV
jgi:hypothetical protein